MTEALWKTRGRVARLERRVATLEEQVAQIASIIAALRLLDAVLDPGATPD